MTPIDGPRLDELYKKALQIEKHLTDERSERFKQREAEKKELSSLRRLRLSRREESLSYARDIFEWIRHFAKSAKGSKILAVLGEVAIFQDHYWDCMPRDGHDYLSMLILDSQGTLRYREYFRGTVNSNGRILVGAEDMVGLLHPAYIRSAAQAMAIGEVYDNIERGLKQRWAQPFRGRVHQGQTSHL